MITNSDLCWASRRKDARFSFSDIHPSGSRKSLDGSINDGTEIDSETVSDIPPAASSDESAAEETCEPEAEKPDLTIPIEDLKELYTTKHADEDRLFREEMKVHSEGHNDWSSERQCFHLPKYTLLIILCTKIIVCAGDLRQSWIPKKFVSFCKLD